MRITITYENNMNENGEDSLVSFEKQDVETVEEVLNAMGRSLHAAGFTYVSSLTAHTDDDNHFWAYF